MSNARRLAAIMFTDTVGYSTSAHADEAGALKQLQEQAELVRPLFAEFHGRQIKSTGDGFLVEFESALRATQCAVEIQRRLHERSSQTERPVFQIRIGIHVGDVEQQGEDIFGDAVNIASRVEPLADPGGVCVSQQVFDQVRNKVPNSLEKLGPRTLKGLQEPLELYRVVLPWTRQVASVGAPSRPRLAVLPLTNISPDPKDEYFADGLTEELISVLSHVSGLQVIARTSVSQYKSTTKSIAQIGAELGVTSVIEGSVRKAGNRLRITLQAIDVATQGHTWAESYNREVDDVFAIQADVAERTAAALKLELLKADREAIQERPTTSLTAYELYLQAIAAYRRDHLQGFTQGVQLLEEALRLDPKFSLAYSYLAHLLISSLDITRSKKEVFERSRELIAQALALAPNSPEAHTQRGNFALQLEHDWNEAETELKRAISLNPSDHAAHAWYGLLLATLQRYDEAKSEYRTAMELDPTRSNPGTALGFTYVYSGEIDSARALCARWLERTPDDAWPHLILAYTQFALGEMDSARREAELVTWPTGTPAGIGSVLRASIIARGGHPEDARRLLAQLLDASRVRYVSLSWVALLRAALGEKELALDALERDYSDGDQALWWHYDNLVFDTIRDDPRFIALLKAMNLPMTAPWRNLRTGPRTGAGVRAD